MRSAYLARATFVAAFLLTSLRAQSADACAPAPGPAAPPIEVRGEEALIVWDGAKKEEHFIRRAVFDTSVKSFGFLVPTPSRPELAEAKTELFEALRDATKPETVTETDYEIIPSLLFIFLARSKSAAAVSVAGIEAMGSVSVLEERRVAGMDATVLAATNADALAKWLSERGFEFRPALRDWLGPYVEAGYTITAFRYERPDIAANGPLGLPPVAPSAVRLSFRSEAPFYPYREPSDAPQVAGRRLRLFMIGADRLEAGLGPKLAPWSTTHVRFADEVSLPTSIGGALSGVTLPPKAWITEFVDDAGKREPFDLTFRKANAVKVRPPPIVRFTQRVLFLPIEIILPLAFGIVWLVRRARPKAST